MQKIGRYVIVTFVLVLAAFFGGLFSGRASGRKEMMTEAVKQNHGHYRIVDDIGSTVFEWGAGPAPVPAPGVAPAPK